MVDDVVPVGKSDITRYTFAIDGRVDEFTAVVEVDRIFFVASHARLYIPFR